MTQTLGQSVCRSGLNSFKGPCLWPWKICPLLSTVTHYIIHAFAVVLTDPICKVTGKGIMFISNVNTYNIGCDSGTHYPSGEGCVAEWFVVVGRQG